MKASGFLNNRNIHQCFLNTVLKKYWVKGMLLADLVNFYVVFGVHLYFAASQELRVWFDAWEMKGAQEN